jgi:hypothetical protein
VLCVCRYYDNVCAQSVHDEEFSAARAQRAVGLRPVRTFVSHTGAYADGTAVFELTVVLGAPLRHTLDTGMPRWRNQVPIGDLKGNIGKLHGNSNYV